MDKLTNTRVAAEISLSRLVGVKHKINLEPFRFDDKVLSLSDEVDSLIGCFFPKNPVTHTEPNQENTNCMRNKATPTKMWGGIFRPT
ncbi:hypothetical protein MKK50_15185 [Methylobacterium sp. J-043]|nr:hypothetical protein [Methylobacterium sp. J-043]